MKKSRWWEHLNEEDRMFIKRFLLASGSLKQVASEYGVSYPTIRLRLDRLIQKLQLLEKLQSADEFEVTAATLLSEGRLDENAFELLLKTHRRSVGRSAQEAV